MRMNSVYMGPYYKRAFFPVLVAVTIVLVLPLKAQNASNAQGPSLSDLQSSYERARIDATVPFAEELRKLVDGYEGALVRLQEGFQAKGQLEDLLVVRTEAEFIKKSGQPGSEEVDCEELVKLRGIFADSKQSIVDRQEAAMQGMASTYKGALENLVVDLTKVGKVEEALKAKAIAEAITVDNSDNVKPLNPVAPVSRLGTPSDSGDMPGAGEIPIKVTSRAEKRLTEVPEVEAPLVGPDIFSSPDWPLLVMIPQGDYEIEGQVKYNSEKGRMLAFSDGSSFRGKGDKPYWNVANAITVGKGLRFEGFNFRGNLSSRLYFEQCSFDDMLMGKGGGWFGGAFMSRWQFRDCSISGSFTDVWGTRHTATQMLGCRIEEVTFPPLEYQNEDEPSAIALNDEMMILDSYFYNCEIPVSVLSLTEDCAFVDCRFVSDPKPVTLANKVKRTLKVENCEVKYEALPANLEFKLEELPRR